MKVDLCAVTDIPEQGTLEVPFFGRSLHVTKVEGRPIAYANACMHFGGPLAPDENGVLQCAWHGAGSTRGRARASMAPRRATRI